MVSEISCKEDDKCDINDNGLKWLIYYGKTKNNKYSIDDLGSIDWALIEGFRMLKTQTYYDAEKVESMLWKRIRSILNLNPHKKNLNNMEKTVKIIGFILLIEYPNCRKKVGDFEPVTTGEFLQYPLIWKPIYN